MTAPADRWRSSRRGWAITAAVLAAIVCLACWPRPTLGVLGIVVGTGAVLAGLRGLLAEHRRQAPAADTGPDASGRAPETARQHPDASAEQPADQGGDHPDDLRTTPPLTGPMPATETPRCGTILPSTDGIPCGDTATWHIRWAPGDGETFPAGLACDTHMEQLRNTLWYERHPAGPDCGTRTATWTPEHCTPDEETTPGGPS